MRIAFVWQESSKPEVFNRWDDGLRAAMKIVEQNHVVTYHEPFDDITEVDLILYWEAPCTINGKNSANWLKVCANSIPKILLFAGGPIQANWVKDFDLVIVESQINYDECTSLGIPCEKAFGINTDIFKPVPQSIIFSAVHHGTFAGWKHQPLIAEALKDKALLIGKFQEHEFILVSESKRHGALVLPQIPYALLPHLICSANTCVNMSDYWGGGQRTTLEAMACGIPVICREDSPKNREYVEESGFGEVVSPSVPQIQAAVSRLIQKNFNPEIGVNYVHSKWTHKHYAEKILNAINSLHNNSNI